MKLSEAEREFLEAVRDGKSVIRVLRRRRIGVEWAIREGFVLKHPAWFEFIITDDGRAALKATEREGDNPHPEPDG